MPIKWKYLAFIAPICVALLGVTLYWSLVVGRPVPATVEAVTTVSSSPATYGAQALCGPAIAAVPGVRAMHPATSAGQRAERSAGRSGDPTEATEVQATPVGSIGGPVAPLSDDAPLPPLPASTTVGAMTGCGGQSAGEGSQRGSTPSALLGFPVALPLVVEGIARTAQITGPVGTMTADPATRPD